MTSQPQNELTIPTITTTADDDDDDAEEITETKIIGVTETGVIRKRSFKRKLTKEERSKRGYGNDKVEYEKIVQRVQSERFFSSAIEGLQERWKMLCFMHTDCLDMVAEWEKRREELRKTRRNKDMDLIIVASVALFGFLMLCWLIKACIWW